MSLNVSKTLALGLAISGCICQTKADVDYTVGGTADLETFNIEFNNSYYQNTYAGGLQITQTGAIDTALPTSYVSMCADFLGSLYIGSTYAYSSSLVSFAGQDGIDPKWSAGGLSIQNAAYIFNTFGDVGAGGVGTGTTGAYVSDYSNASTKVEYMAALQLAVWMALYDTVGTGVTAGQVKGTAFTVKGGDSGAIALANSWILGLTGNYGINGSLLQPDLGLGAQGNPDCQDPQELLVNNSANPQTPPPSVPEPGTIFAGAMLLLPLGASMARVLRKSKQ